VRARMWPPPKLQHPPPSPLDLHLTLHLSYLQDANDPDFEKTVRLNQDRGVPSGLLTQVKRHEKANGMVRWPSLVAATVST
jgi:hypothetical protein